MIKIAKILSITLLVIQIAISSSSAKVLINEVELDPSGDGDQWVELYNAGDEEVDVSGWSIVPLSNSSKEGIIFLTNLSANSFYVLNPEEEWLNSWEETLILKDDEGIVVDRTPPLYDLQDNDCAWGRYPDGSPTWLFMAASMGGPNTGEACEDVEIEIQRFKFAMDRKVSGSGFVHIRSSITAAENQNVLSQEHGSGSYDIEEAGRYTANLVLGSHNIGLNKSDFSARHDEAEQNVTPKRSVKYDSRWSESSQAWSDRDSPYIAESTRYAKSIHSNLQLQSSNRYLTAIMDSEFQGRGRIESKLSNLKSSEEYAGSFKVLSNILKQDSKTVESSVTGEGFVDVRREIMDTAKTYQRGTGAYQADEQIDISKGSLNKDINLAHHPVNYSYSEDRPINRSLTWSEGTRSGERGASFIRTDFSNLKRLESETSIISAGYVKMAANFSGKARMQAAFKNPSDDTSRNVYIDNEYIGDYSIYRQISIMPSYKIPHLTIYSQGRIHQPKCDRLVYTITLVNDGNKGLGPIYLKASFPPGTRFMNASAEPFELYSRYGNWSIPYLGVGSSISLDLNLQINARLDNYTNRIIATTVYQQTIRNTTRERRLRASNSSLLEANWSNCRPQNISATFTASSKTTNPAVLNYRLTIQNMADVNMNVNVTAFLPQELKFINSTLKPLQITEDEIFWTISKFAPDKRRTISFMAKAAGEGLLTANANIRGIAADGEEIASIDVSAPFIIGKSEVISKTYDPDWLLCDENKIPG